MRLGEVQADVVHLDDGGDHPVHRDGEDQGHDDEDDESRHERLVGHLVEGDHHNLGGEDEIGADRPGLTSASSADRRGLGVMPGDAAHIFSAPS